MTVQKRQALLWCCPFFVLSFFIAFMFWSGCAVEIEESPSPFVVAISEYPVYPDGFVIQVAVQYHDNKVHFRTYDPDQIEIDPGLRVGTLGDKSLGALRMWSYNCLPVNWKSGEIYTVKVYDGENLLRSIRYHFLATTE